MALKAYIEDDIINFDENVSRGKFSFDNKIPIYQMTIELQSGVQTQLEIFCDSDPFQLAKDFCSSNGLSEASINYLKDQIAELQAISERHARLNVIEELDEEDFSLPSKKRSNIQRYNESMDYTYGILIKAVSQEGTSSLNASFKEQTKQKDRKSYFSALTKPTEEPSYTVPLKNTSEMISSEQHDKNEVTAKSISTKKRSLYVPPVVNQKPFKANMFHYDIIDTHIEEQVSRTQKKYKEAMSTLKNDPEKVFERLYTAAVLRRRMPAKTQAVEEEQEERIKPDLSFTSGVKLGKRMYERGMKSKTDFALELAKERFEHSQMEKKGCTHKPKINKFKSFENMSLFSVSC